MDLNKEQEVLVFLMPLPSKLTAAVKNHTSSLSPASPVGSDSVVVGRQVKFITRNILHEHKKWKIIRADEALTNKAFEVLIA